MSIITNKQEHTISVECDKCSVFEEHDLDDSLHSIIKELINRNWKVINNKVFICPDCNNVYNKIWSSLRDESLIHNGKINRPAKYVDYEDEEEDLQF